MRGSTSDAWVGVLILTAMVVTIVTIILVAFLGSWTAPLTEFVVKVMQ